MTETARHPSPETLTPRPITLKEIIAALVNHPDFTGPDNQQQLAQITSRFEKAFRRRAEPSPKGQGDVTLDRGQPTLSPDLVTNILNPPEQFFITFLGRPESSTFETLQHLVRSALTTPPPESP